MDCLRIARDPATTDLVANVLAGKQELNFTEYARFVWSMGCLGGEHAFHRELEQMMEMFDLTRFKLPIKNGKAIVDIGT